jgi:hypothetical protein
LVEARIVGDPSSARGREKRIENAVEDLNRAAPPGFTVMLSILREGSATPRGSELRERIVPWLEGLDQVWWRAAVEAGTNPPVPERNFKVGEWTFKARAWPEPTTPRESGPRRLVSVGPVRTGVGGSTKEFTAALRSKMGRYELAGRPYLVALGNTHMFQSYDDPLDVLYGNLALHFTEDDGPESHPRLFRKPNGLFRPDRNRQVSAVLHIPRLAPWSVGATRPELWLNPFATNPLPTSLPWATEIALTGTTITRRDPERPLLELFQLPEAWPGPEQSFERRGSA